MNSFYKFNPKNEVDYWFNNIENHGEDVYSYGPKYYVAAILERILPVLKIPNSGKICMLGTHKCYSFSLLENFFGEKNCIGYDLLNITKRSNIIEGSIIEIEKKFIPPLSFCWNDLGNYSRNPYEKMFGQIVFSNRIVKGGFFIGRDGSNRARFPVETLMDELSFESTNLLNYFIDKSIDYSDLDESILKSHLISIKK
ncbi:MAG: hypothetical protein JJ837_07845 [Prochlorococcus marinus XMU1428]|nr:hypothetical protein [Prochlorococcus marinus XMU1428]